MRAKKIDVFPTFGRALAASVVETSALARQLGGDVAIRAFGPVRALIILRNVGDLGVARS